MQLRDYQLDLKTGLYKSWHSGNRNVVLVSPTGSGKTVVMGSIASDQTVPGCIIAHRTELVGQISMALARFGIEHNVIAPSTTVKFCISQHVAELGRKYYNQRGMVTVAAVDTLLARSGKLTQWSAQQRWWMIDECFPAGTLVDGRPIETIRVGDYVTAFNEADGTFQQRRVNRLFKNPMPKNMVRIATAHHVVYATGGHPFWTQRGWVEAGDLRNDDYVLLHMREGCTTVGAIRQDGPGVLQQGMFDGAPSEDFIGNDGANEQEVCFGANDGEQPNEVESLSGENAKHAFGDEASSENSRREWETSNGSGKETHVNSVAVWVRGTACGSDRISQGNGAGTLQDRLCQSNIEDCNRGGRIQSFIAGTTSVGCEEGRISEWQRLESVTVLEQGDSEFPRGSYVYNIEVDGFHTYVANGIVVHNCHHVIANNKWGKATALFQNAYGCGVTATPVRADRKSLHADQGGVFNDMIVGPSMRQLIDAGSLCDYRIFAPPQSIDVSEVKIGSTGDYSQPGLREAAHKSQIVGDVVSHYKKLADGLRGITFTVDVEQATQLAAAFCDAGVPAMAVSAKTPDFVRSEAVRKLRDGKLLQLVNVDLFGEGFDVPAVEVVSMARPTMSYGLYVQQFGRALRTLQGKSHGIIIDHVGNVKAHGLPDAPRQWSLYAEERGKRGERDPDVMPVKTCTSCFAAYEAVTKACPFCGHVPEPESRGGPEYVDGDLIELDPETLAAMRGEVDKIDGPAMVPYGATDVVEASVKKRWRERQEAQAALRNNIAMWAGVWRDKGADDSEIYRRFFFTFGTDIMSAQALGRADAEKLSARIESKWNN